MGPIIDRVHARPPRIAPIALVPLVLGAAGVALDDRPPLDFDRDVRPVLEARCASCHGPDKQKAGLRLDTLRGVLDGAALGAEPVVVPGRRDESELWRRITTADEDERMPPKSAPLEPDVLELLGAWIDQGAPGTLAARRGADHWAWRAPERPPVPHASDPSGVRSPIDAFVRARLEREGLAPAPQADPATLLRRASLDLTGLPPSLDQLDTFLAEWERDSERAWADALERLLASPHYAERRAQTWLDLARYADTDGYEKDQRRTMWRWRDWVIDAYDRDLPFDEFTIAQLAGDLLPEPTRDDLVATGFHRNTLVNREDGIDPEEFRNAAVVDRVDTTASVWLGTTMACAQCHDHPYDPFSTEDYYRLFAFFDQTTDSGDSQSPTIVAPTAREDARRVDELERRMRALEDELDAPWPDAEPEQRAWERATLADLGAPPRWRALRPLRASAAAGSTLAVQGDGSVLATGATPPLERYELVLEAPGRVGALRLETLGHATLPDASAGRAADGSFVLSRIEARDATGRALRFVAAEASREQRGGFRAARALGGPADRGWGVKGGDGAEHAAVFALAEPVDVAGELVVTLDFAQPGDAYLLGRFRLSATDDEALLARMAPIERSDWQSLGPFPAASAEEAAATDHGPLAEHLRGAAHADRGEGVAWQSVPQWSDGAVHAFEPGGPSATYLARTLRLDEPRAFSVWLGADDFASLWVDGELVHRGRTPQPLAPDQDRVTLELDAGEHRVLLAVVDGDGSAGFFFDVDHRAGDGPSADVALALRTAPEERTHAQRDLLRRHWRGRVSTRGRALVARLDELRATHADLTAGMPTALVLEEREEPRVTHVHRRGNFLAPGERVEPDVPALLLPFAEGEHRNRLGLARWLVDPRHPLTARVTVNRLWEELFGVGLVPTGSDFGTRGDAPADPELLDWLALELVERGWSTKEMLRLIASSATYRQASEAPADLLERDPTNALLARGPRERVPAETVRDVALFASGLLDPTIGGPSVFPVQPEGIWNPTYSDDVWTAATDWNRYRRGLYTFWRRTSPYPTFLLFDATSRETTCARRARTSTPLQALALLNDPAFVEAAVGLARRIVREAGPDPAERAAHGFRLCTARRPTERELALLLELWEAERAHYASRPEAARRLAAPEGPLADLGEHDPRELAPWIVVANALLNLDETITKR